MLGHADASLGQGAGGVLAPRRSDRHGDRQVWCGVVRRGLVWCVAGFGVMDGEEATPV